MPVPKVGTTYRYQADAGLGAQARVADPDLDDVLPSDMADLDMQPDTVVRVSGYDEDRELVLVEWTDRHDTPRTTSLTADAFAEQFHKEK